MHCTRERLHGQGREDTRKVAERFGMELKALQVLCIVLVVPSPREYSTRTIRSFPYQARPNFQRWP